MIHRAEESRVRARGEQRGWPGKKGERTGEEISLTGRTREREEEEETVLMSPALYADEEGRATMTRDVAYPGPFVSGTERNSSAAKGVSRDLGCSATRKRGVAAGGEPLRLVAWHQRVSSSGYHLPDTLMYYASIH